MGIKDLIVTPFYLVFFILLAYWIRPYVTTRQTKKYFIPTLLIRLFGAISLGLIYQFYYGGGDTFNYFDHGSRWIWEAFLQDPIKGLKLLSESGGARQSDTYEWSQNIWYYRDEKSFIIVRITAFFDLFTLHTYSATALFFALFSFSGLWAFSNSVIDKYGYSKWIILSILLFPTSVFWGSGILKDTITLGALGWLTWSLINLIDLKKRGLIHVLIAFFSLVVIFSIKEYIVVCYLPLVSIWIYFKWTKSITSKLIRRSFAPLLLMVFISVGYLLLGQLTEISPEYSMDNVSEKVAITAYDIRYGWGARTGGDGGYDLGVLDGRWESMVKLAPAAINVTLFRPYVWEVKNPLMILASAESLMILVLFLRFIYKRSYKKLAKDPFLIFCLGFTLLFAFAVGVSTYNFGTLMRYKIPILPYLSIILVVGSFDMRTRKS